MVAPTSKIWKNILIGPKISKAPYCIMSGTGRFFQNYPQKPKFIKHVYCVLMYEKIDAQYSFTGKRTKAKRKH